MRRFPRYLWLLPAIACLVCGLMLLFNPGSMARSVFSMPPTLVS